MLSLILVVIAAIFKSVMDVLYFRWNKSIFSKIKSAKFQQFSNPRFSWVNKWKNGNPNEGEKFFGSSTFLVFLTDLWHLAQTIMLTSFMVAIVLYTPIFTPIIDVFILYAVYAIVFETFYRCVFISKKQ